MFAAFAVSSQYKTTHTYIHPTVATKDEILVVNIFVLQFNFGSVNLFLQQAEGFLEEIS
jgi:hypothetical protein